MAHLGINVLVGQVSTKLFVSSLRPRLRTLLRVINDLRCFATPGNVVRDNPFFFFFFVEQTSCYVQDEHERMQILIEWRGG